MGRPVAKRIYDKVSELRVDPYSNIRKLRCTPYFRLRVGDYRVILEIRKKELYVLVLKVGHRSVVYK